MNLPDLPQPPDGADASAGPTALPPLPSGGAPSDAHTRAALLAPFVRDDVVAMAGEAFDRLLSHPSAFASFFGDDEEGDEDCPYEVTDGVAVYSVRGALAQRGGRFWCWSWPGYDVIGADLSRALADERVRSVALVIDSPGGVVAGCFDAVRAMRAAVEASGKRVVALADEACFSAAYALACVADEIVVPETGGVGSVGVIGVSVSYAKALAAAGVDARVYTSGAEKGDNHPALPVSKGAAERSQARVDEFAGVFHRWVASRRKMTPEGVAALEAGVRFGQAAVAAGLADRVQPVAQALAALRAQGAPAAPPMASASTAAEVRAALDALVAADAARSPSDASDASDAPGVDHATATPSTTPHPTEIPTMTLPASSPVLAALGAKSEADALAVVTALINDRKVLLSTTGAATPGEAHGVVEAWKRDSGALAALRAEVAQERQTRDASDRRALLEQGVKDMKITPAERDADGQPEAWTTALATPALKSFMLSRKGMVAPPPVPLPKLGSASALTEDQRKMARQMGISEEAFAKQLAAAESTAG